MGKHKEYTTSINIPVTKEFKARIERTAKSYGISVAPLVRNILENMIPFDEVPEEFIEQSKISLLIKNNSPIRTAIPYTASVLGLHFDNWTVRNDKGDEVEINPLPEHGVIFMIFLMSKFYRAYKRLL